MQVLVSICLKKKKLSLFAFVEHVCAIKIQELDAVLTVALEALILFLRFNELNLGSVLEGVGLWVTQFDFILSLCLTSREGREERM